MEAKIEEIWKSVSSFPKYEVSTFGRVRHIKNGIRKAYHDAAGYARISCSKNGRVSYFKIHQAVAIAFIHNPFGKKNINHKDGVKSNNRLDNLEWCTHQENDLHAKNNGLLRPPLGERCHQAKLNTASVLKIKELIRCGVSNTKIALMFSVQKEAVRRIKVGRTWKHI